MPRLNRGLGFGVLALFTSLGSLLCCALPILLVALGLGSVVAAVTLQFPFLATLSEYKSVMFGVSAGLLAPSAWFIWHRQKCPADDPVLAVRCQEANRLGRRVFRIASLLWLTGMVASYLLLPLRQIINA